MDPGFECEKIVYLVSINQALPSFSVVNLKEEQLHCSNCEMCQKENKMKGIKEKENKNYVTDGTGESLKKLQQLNYIRVIVIIVRH